MKAALFSQGSESSQWTAAAMEKHFAHVDHILLQDVEVVLDGKELEILHNGRPIEQYDCIYLKGSHTYASLLRSISSALEGTTYLPLQHTAFTVGHDKLLTHLVLQQHKIPMPKTYLSSTSDSFAKILDKVRYPIVVKFPSGQGGKGVMFAESKASASALLDALVVLKQPFIIQEYVETDGVDIRLLVLGDHVVAAMKRKASSGEKRANIHSGGIGEQYVPDAVMRKLAVRAARAVGAQICGVDILEGPKGPLVVEVNLSPGLQGIVQTTKIDVPDKIARYLAEQTHLFVESKRQGTSSNLFAELGIEPEQQEARKLITTLDFRSERMLLPKMVTDVTGFNEDEDVELEFSKNELRVRKFMR